ncbi:hypothetical protein ACA910_004645 [Epithemia clementina (nom. ined.)]
MSHRSCAAILFTSSLDEPKQYYSYYSLSPNHHPSQPPPYNTAKNKKIIQRSASFSAVPTTTASKQTQSQSQSQLQSPRRAITTNTTSLSTRTREPLRSILKKTPQSSSQSQSQAQQSQPPEPCDSPSSSRSSLHSVLLLSSPVVVQYGTVHVYEFAMILGDHPAVSEGPPVTLSWHCSHKHQFASVDDHERHTRQHQRRQRSRLDSNGGRRKSSSSFYLSSGTRGTHLLCMGYSLKQIVAASAINTNTTSNLNNNNYTTKLRSQDAMILQWQQQQQQQQPRTLPPFLAVHHHHHHPTATTAVSSLPTLPTTKPRILASKSA